MKKRTLLILFLSIIYTYSCELNSYSQNNESQLVNEIIVGTFALERFDSSNKRHIESVQVTQGTWDTYNEGDEFEYDENTWIITMKVPT
tara:strand:- start:406 stop:672 length:267 start_codon:yes stop_codon:yes gene_type:complete